MKAVKKEDGKIVLNLRDNEGHEGVQSITTNATPGEAIIWLTENNSIKEIVNIRKSGGDGIFSEGPTKNSDTEWQGIIAEDAVNKKESYSIEYIYVDGNKYVDDPDIEVVRPPEC